MELDLCDGNQSDSNVLLPPRKRLLAGLKKRDLGKKPVNAPSSEKKVVTDPKIDFLTKTYLENRDLSCKEIAEDSKRAADVALLLVVAAKAKAEKKSIIAANAMAFAKGVLEIMADITDEVNSYDRHLKKNKMKKHLPVKTINKKHGNAENRKTDEELARSLHVSMNRSPRTVKNSANSDVETYTNKRGKGLFISEGPKDNIKGHGEREAEAEARETYSEDLTREGRIVGVDGSVSKRIKDKSLKIGHGEAESSHSRERVSESSDDLSGVGRKRRRMKQKKLPLNVRSFKDLSTTNDEIKSKSNQLSEENIGKNSAGLNSMRLRPDSMIPAEPASTWKCKALKTPDCVKQNKVMEP